MMLSSLSARRSSLLFAAAISVLLVAGCRDRPTTVEPPTTPVTAAGSPGMAPPDIGALSILDRDFLKMAASASEFEIEASRLALERSSDNNVRAFALRMVDEHSALHSRLRDHVARLGLASVPPMLPMDSEELQRLRALKGELFDREYVAQAGVAAHVEAAGIYERAATTVADAQLRAFAEKTAPMLKKHRQTAEELAQQIGVPADRLQAARSRPAVATQTTIGTTGVTGTVRGDTVALPGDITTPGAASVPGGGMQSTPAAAGAGESGSGK